MDGLADEIAAGALLAANAPCASEGEAAPDKAPLEPPAGGCEREGEWAEQGHLSGCLAMAHGFIEVAETLSECRTMPFMSTITDFWERTCPATLRLIEACASDPDSDQAGGDPAVKVAHRLRKCQGWTPGVLCPSAKAAAAGSGAGSWVGALRILGRALSRPRGRARPALPVRLSHAVMCRMVMSNCAQGIIKGPHLDASGRWAALPNGYGAMVVDVDQLRRAWRRGGCARPLSNASRARPPPHMESVSPAQETDLIGLPATRPAEAPARQPATGSAVQTTKRPSWAATRKGVADLCLPMPDIPSAAEPVVGLSPPWVSCDFARFRVQGGRIDDGLVVALIAADVPGQDSSAAGGVLTARFQPCGHGVARLCLCRADGSVTVCEPRATSPSDP